MLRVRKKNRLVKKRFFALIKRDAVPLPILFDIALIPIKTLDA